MLMFGEQICHVSTCQRAECVATGACHGEVKPKRAEVCTWTLDDDEHGIWQTTCDTAWSFIDGGPEDNSCNYCHKCGGALVIVRPEPEADDDDDAV